ncbi:hypothetical protein [Quadrisphaera oryzae]|nr:hypothetical protein [Quadrisphaera sp. RL12-1S]
MDQSHPLPACAAAHEPPATDAWPEDPLVVVPITGAPPLSGALG